MSTETKWDGLPPNPDQSGWHWLRFKGGGLAPWHWTDASGMPGEFEWTDASGMPGEFEWEEACGDGRPDVFASQFSYHAPCVPPDVAASVRVAKVGE